MEDDGLRSMKRLRGDITPSPSLLSCYNPSSGQSGLAGDVDFARVFDDYPLPAPGPLPTPQPRPPPAAGATSKAAVGEALMPLGREGEARAGSPLLGGDTGPGAPGNQRQASKAVHACKAAMGKTEDRLQASGSSAPPAPLSQALESTELESPACGSPLRLDHLSPFLVSVPGPLTADGGQHGYPPPGGANQASPPFRPMLAPTSLSRQASLLSQPPAWEDLGGLDDIQSGSHGLERAETPSESSPWPLAEVAASREAACGGSQEEFLGEERGKQSGGSPEAPSCHVAGLLSRESSSEGPSLSGGRAGEAREKRGDVALTRRPSVEEVHGPPGIPRKGSISSSRSSKSILVREDKHGSFLTGFNGKGKEGGWAGYGGEGDDGEWEGMGGVSGEPSLPRGPDRAIRLPGPARAIMRFGEATAVGEKGAFETGRGGGVSSSTSGPERGGHAVSSALRHLPDSASSRPGPAVQKGESEIFFSPTMGQSASSPGNALQSSTPPPHQSLPLLPEEGSATGGHVAAAEREGDTCELASAWERIGPEYQAVLPDLLDDILFHRTGKEEKAPGRGVRLLSDTRPSSVDTLGAAGAHSDEASGAQQEAVLVWSSGWEEGSLERAVAATGGGRASAAREWSVAEIADFDKGVHAYRRCFDIIHRKCLPGKSVRRIVAWFYDEFKRSPGYRAWKEDKLIGRRVVLRQKRPRWKGGGWEEVKGTIQGSIRDEEGDELLTLNYDDGRVGQLYRYEAEPLLLGPGDEGEREEVKDGRVESEASGVTSQEEGTSLSSPSSSAGEHMDVSLNAERAESAQNADEVDGLEEGESDRQI